MTGAWLEGSALEATDQMHDDKRLYRLWIADARNVGWLQSQAGNGIARRLTSLLKQPVALQVVPFVPEFSGNGLTQLPVDRRGTGVGPGWTGQWSGEEIRQN
jgi:hypothetical protein